MALSPGTRLGPYEILSPIGAGGMGEVHRARDTKLKRDVAIKVLPEAFAKDEERMKRFAREAEVLASLNHPNIASIYGLEESDGITALVLEMVEGPTLAERIAEGPIPLDEALPIARQLAEGLEAAHEEGVIHRDLKPANAKVKYDGTVKILDFGLAKVFNEESEGDSSESPTMTAAATRAGVIMGTAAYMSPEQARGKSVDKRADIWAFGAVLYEMLTGRRAFEAEDVSLTLAEVMKSEPQWDALPSDVSPTLRTYLTRCLNKDPKKRVRDIGEVRLALQGAFELPVPASEPAASKRRTLPWIAAVIATGLVVWGLTRPDAPRVTRLTVSTAPSSALLLTPGMRDLAISPNGEWLVYDGGRALNVRHIDRFETMRLDIVGNPDGPFVSPDSDWVGFVAAGTLQKIPVLGGHPTTICKIESGFLGASWGSDDSIVFAAARAGLFRVPAGGGEPRQLTKPDGSEIHVWPEMLPGNEAVLYTIDRGRSDTSGFDIAVLSLDSGESRVLIRGRTSPRYAPTGHLVYVVEGALMVVPFDAETLETTGDAAPALSGVFPKFSGAANFDVSDNGVLIYLPGDPGGGNRSLVWVDRLGREEPLGFGARSYTSVALSPAGDRVVSGFRSARGDASDVWIHDVIRGTFTRLTFDTTIDIFPLWTPDGERVVFQSNREGPRRLFWKAVDGTGPAERLSEDWVLPFSVSPDGRTLIGVLSQTETSWDVVEVSLDGDPTVKPLVVGPRIQWYPQISPSGKWLSYSSDESGQTEIYVRPYPDVDAGRWQISTNGGRSPMWSPREDELFYRNAKQMLAVPVATGRGFEPGAPLVLFEGSYYFSQAMKSYDVTPDGQRFLMIKEDALGESNEIHVVLNWFEDLRALQ